MSRQPFSSLPSHFRPAPVGFKLGPSVPGELTRTTFVEIQKGQILVWIYKSFTNSCSPAKESLSI
jgi:hypothetical protein